MTDREKLIELLVECSCIDGAGAELIEKKADHLLANGVTLQRWIPVTERLPDTRGQYLVAFHPCYWDDVKENKTFVGIDTFKGKTTWARNKFQRVTHWMPLPEAPEEDKP